MVENSTTVKGKLMSTHKTSIIWALPIILYLLSSTTAAVYWAGTTTQSLATMQLEFSEFVDQSYAENLRQWGRINANEDSVKDVNTGISVTNARLEALKENLDRLETQSLETNRLLRELIERRDHPGGLQ